MAIRAYEEALFHLSQLQTINKLINKRKGAHERTVKVTNSFVMIVQPLCACVFSCLACESALLCTLVF